METVARRNGTLYHHPWAKLPVHGSICQLPQAVPEEGKMSFKEGRSFSEIFGLASTWPE
jgi:hypothetical protein